MSTQPSHAQSEPDPEEVLKQLGARIKMLRLEKGNKNYEKFAIEHDISRSQYWRYEQGEDLRFTTLLRVIKALDINLKDFFSEGFDQKL